jgi:hypothetical protein
MQVSPPCTVTSSTESYGLHPATEDLHKVNHAVHALVLLPQVKGMTDVLSQRLVCNTCCPCLAIHLYALHLNNHNQGLA